LGKDTGIKFVGQPNVCVNF